MIVADQVLEDAVSVIVHQTKHQAAHPAIPLRISPAQIPKLLAPIEEAPFHPTWKEIFSMVLRRFNWRKARSFQQCWENWKLAL